MPECRTAAVSKAAALLWYAEGSATLEMRTVVAPAQQRVHRSVADVMNDLA